MKGKATQDLLEDQCPRGGPCSQLMGTRSGGQCGAGPAGVDFANPPTPPTGPSGAIRARQPAYVPGEDVPRQAVDDQGGVGNPFPPVCVDTEHLTNL